VIGERGAAAPLAQTVVKEGHVAATVTGPARGPLCPTLWTFAGTLSKTDMCAGAPGDYWNKTANGWPDVKTVRAWAKIMVDEKAKRSLKQMLIVVDNAAIHMDLQIASLFRANNIVLLGMIPSATSKMQPLDKLFFAPIKKAKIPTIASRLGCVRSFATIAKLFHMAVEEMEESARK